MLKYVHRNVNTVVIRDYINTHESKYPDDSLVCKALYDITNTYSADYSNNDINEATFVRDTVDIFLRHFFPNTPISKSIDADAMISDSSKRFTRLDPSLTNHGKRADFSVISTKSNHVLLSLEAKSNRTKHVNELIKLCRELKDSMKAIHEDNYYDVPIIGILLRGNICDIYCMDHKYDGIYRVVLLKKLHFPIDCFQMHLLLSIIPMFQKLAETVHSTALKLRNRPDSNTSKVEDIVSMHTPITVRVGKRKLDKDSLAVQQARCKLFT